MTLGDLLSRHCRCVTYNASYLIMALYSSLKREPTRSTTLWGIEICLQSCVGNFRVTDLHICKVNKNNPIKKTKLFSCKVLYTSKPTLNCPGCSRPFEMKTGIHTHKRSCIPFLSTVTKQVNISNNIPHLISSVRSVVENVV